MRIASTKIASTQRRVQPAKPLQLDQPLDSVELGGGNPLSELWRDYGINPKAMVHRAFVKGTPTHGAPLDGGKPANALVSNTLRLGHSSCREI